MVGTRVVLLVCYDRQIFIGHLTGIVIQRWGMLMDKKINSFIRLNFVFNTFMKWV